MIAEIQDWKILVYKIKFISRNVSTLKPHLKKAEVVDESGQLHKRTYEQPQ